MSGEQLLTLAMDMGERMIICGAEANRVEDTIRRICTAYGCIKVELTPEIVLAIQQAAEDAGTTALMAVVSQAAETEAAE